MLVFVLIMLFAMTIHADSFSVVDQAIWIDRHNYFRTTGLPWSAGNMRRIGWSTKLASSAALRATKCSMTSGPGVNVYQSTSTNSPTIIDDAIKQWIVTTSETTLKMVKQPGASNVDVGAGIYNSYSQVLWASTTSVGCANQKCPSGDIVVCEYSPPGNDGSSPWYNHADTASKCPSGTKPSQGLCIVEGDAANNPIAPIPAGKLTYEVYPAYVPHIQALLLEAARDIASGKPAKADASMMSPSTPPTSNGAVSYAPKTANTPTPGSIKPKTSQSPGTTPSSPSTTPSSQKTTPSSSPISNPTTNTPEPSPKKTTVSKNPSDSPIPETGKQTSTPDSKGAKTAIPPDAKKLNSTATINPKLPTNSSDEISTNQSSDTSPSGSDGTDPGKVKASTDTGSKFSNQAQEPSDTTPSTDAPSPPASSDTLSSSISNQSSAEESGGISAAGVAGVIVMAVVAIAAFGVIVSYRRNQQRQREIMRDGGIRII
ncbi:RxLR-like protein [Plasmopara halstedii]|uniref:RxLR-like protein n=1 Tax=Plasmopara halstedii TaxID=4781 RepID=A0A0P1ACE1_PLAHL|nr:RxLR-like protein [Plasmopara halstedii]CEG38432.1 RxLR-like protein [Plasmopara halstedii]|eukprot:XP_024574801.1 RxLR-like protein [Plasmopara halstedii]